MRTWSFSTSLYSLLRGAGWSETRHVDVQRYVSTWADMFQPHAVALDVLTSFSGLLITSPSGHFIRFGACAELDTVSNVDLPYVVDLVGGSAYPIGGGSRFIFYLDSIGRFHAIQDEWDTYWVADSFEHGLACHLDFESMGYSLIPPEKHPPGF